jgi:hypothetical protein
MDVLVEKEVDEEKADDVTCLDQYYFVHSNKVILFGISSKHEAIINHSTNPITSVNFDVGGKSRTQ